jgi:L-threonylcarbamoyladenylate synthase
MRTEVIDASPASIARAAELLSDGGIVAFPTETVYGLGARADHRAAVKRIFEAKGRPPDKPLILHVADVAQARSATVGWDDRAQAIADAFWPGPVSIVLRAAPWVPPEVTAGGDTVAVRAPGHEVALALIGACGHPIAAPSANRSGARPPTTAAGVLRTLDGRIPLVVDGGETPVRTPSTLVSLLGEKTTVLRSGSITEAEIERVLRSG